MDLVYLFRVILKRKWIIIGAAIIAGGVAYYFTRNQPKNYRSRAQVSTGFTISDDIKVNNENFSFYEADTKFNNAIVTCLSPSVLSLVSYKLILHDLQDSTPFRRPTAEQKQSELYNSVNKQEAIRVFSDKLETMSLLTSFKPDEKKLLEYLNIYAYGWKSIANGLSAYRLERTDYIQIDYISENPELSAFVVNNVFQQFLRYYKNIRSNKSQESIDTLKSLMEKKKQDLDAKNALLRGEGPVDVGQENSSNFALIGNLQQALNDERNNQITLYASLQKVNQKLKNLGGGTTTTTRSSTDNDELITLRKARNDAYRDYVNANAEDKPALLIKYNTLKNQYNTKAYASNDTRSTDNNSKLRDDLEDQKTGLDIDIEASNTRIASITRQINLQKGNAVQSASKGTAIDILLKDVDLANKEYIAAKQKYSDAMDINTSSVNNFRQILVGQPAIEPEPTKRKLIVGMAGIAAMLTTMLIIMLLAYLDSSVKTPGIFSKSVNLKLICMVNFTNLKHGNLMEILSNNYGKNDPDKQRHNVFRESIRKLRYEIESTGKKIFLFTSTKKGMGKTTLIQALSFSMSLSKKKILIIDTNFCNNDLTVQLNADPVLEKISSDKMGGEKLLVDHIKKISKDIGVGTVFVIGSEGGDYTPSEILPTENLLRHLHLLTNEFDYIFLEGPPLNDFSDSKELARYVDGVIAVFSAQQIIKQIDKESIEFYRESNGKFCGAILNKVDLENVNVT